MHTVVILLGGNQGNVPATFRQCADKFLHLGYLVERSSAIYQSPAWGYTSEHVFYNQVMVLKTNQEPQKVLNELLETEKEFGRTRSGSGNYEDRLIDIDILFYDSMVVNDANLVIPHPKLHLRNFCLTPLDELMPDFIHPVLKKSVAILLNECPDKAKLTVV